MNKFEFIDNELEELEKNHLIRTQHKFSTSQSPSSIINEDKMLLFSSSNYLSMAENRKILERAFDLAKNYGMGSGGSRLTTGNTELHDKLEEIISEFTKYESATLFSSGYNANVGVISAIAKKDCVIFSDEKNHASIIDGCRLSGSKIIVYKHNDMEDLETKIKEFPNNKKIAVSDGVFSMDGDILKLDEFVKITDKYGVISIVDDAHGFGVLGENGRGIVELYKDKHYPDILIGTLSKAIGSEGGFAVSSLKIKKYLIHKARSYVFSTSLSPYVVSFSYEAIKSLVTSNDKVKKLKDNIDYLTSSLIKIGINIDTKTPIIKILIGDEKRAMEISNRLKENNIFVPAIRYPTVMKNEAILRITLMSNHSKDEIDILTKNLDKLLKNN